MSKKKRSGKQQSTSGKTEKSSGVNPAMNRKMAGLTRKQGYIIAGILLVTLVCFFPALSSKKEFTNWDDPVYVVNMADRAHPVVQPVIEKLDGAHFKKMFSTQTDVSLNYHPLTMLSLAINFSFSKLNPHGYVLTNILFHLFNTLLVFIFLYQLSGRKFWVGAVSALLFGIHPMHVESVAWISERKDVLYCFFFLLSCITYLKWIETKKITWMISCFALFFLSCISKAMAVPLPVVLLLIDLYTQRKFSIRSIAEKIPFFLLALWIGYLAVHIQSKEAIAEFKVFTLSQRFMFAAYGFMMYWGKLFLPSGLSAFYNYPALDNNDVPLIYKIAPVIAALIVIIPLFITWKKDKEKFRLLVFGFGFFIAMIALVLQFISVGAAIMADRYSYLPYIGAFFMITMFFHQWFEQKEKRNIAIAVFGGGSLLLAVVCFNRVQVWENSETLWSDVIEKYPYVIEQTGNVVHVKQVGVDNAYKNRGNYYRERNAPGDMDRAFADYDVLVKAHTRDVGAYTNMGNFYGLKGQDANAKNDKEQANKMFTKALEMYSEAIKIKPGNFETMMNRGITWAMMGDHAKALEDFNVAIKINPNATDLYGNIAFEKLQLGKYAESIEDCNRSLAPNPNNANVLFYRGTAYVNTGKYNEAIIDLQNSTRLNPNFSTAWFNLSIAYDKVGNKQASSEAAAKAKTLGYK